MGRQIHFYMIPEDQNAFLTFARKDGPVIITERDSKSALVKPLAELGVNDKTLSLWNQEFLPHLERTWIPDPGYYRVDGLRTPTLEFTPSFAATWEGKPALGQGRVFGEFDPHLEKPAGFENWYKRLVRWIRQNCRRNPTSMGGYVGPAAFELYLNGGYLLPNFLPPRSKVWLAEIGKQHSQSKVPKRNPKRSMARE